MEWVNWGGSAKCFPAGLHNPSSEEEIAQIVRDAVKAGSKVKAFGAGHSFTDIACTDGELINLDGYNKVLSVDRDARTVTVQAGITVWDLAEELASNGLAYQNLGDIGWQSVAGAASTATHGTGIKLGSFSTQVRALTLVTADGSIAECAPEGDAEAFKAAQVSLGALGVISTMTLQCEPAYVLHNVEEPMSFNAVLARLDELIDSNEHFMFWWFPHTDKVLAKRWNRSDRPPKPRSKTRTFLENDLLERRVFGGICALGRTFPRAVPTLAKVVGAVVSGREFTDRSDRVLTTPRYVRFVEMEQSIPRAATADAVRAIRRTIEDRGLRANFPVEVRFVAGDDAFLSPFYGRPSCMLSVMNSKGMPYEDYFRAVEEIARGFGGRPHWGKLHYRTASELRPLYPDWDRFASVRSKLDPDGVFRNAYLDRVLGQP